MNRLDFEARAQYWAKAADELDRLEAMPVLSVPEDFVRAGGDDPEPEPAPPWEPLPPDDDDDDDDSLDADPEEEAAETERDKKAVPAQSSKKT